MPAAASAGYSAAGLRRAPWRDRLAANPTYAFRTAAAIGPGHHPGRDGADGGGGTANSKADPLLAQAVDGAPEAFNFPEPALDLVDQHGHPVTLAEPARKGGGDDVPGPCLHVRLPGHRPGVPAGRPHPGGGVAPGRLVAIDANPRYIATAYLDAFDHQEGLQRTPNWLYLTGTLPQLQHAWRALGGAGRVRARRRHDRPHRVRLRHRPIGTGPLHLDTDPGPATGATESSFAVTLASTLKTRAEGKMTSRTGPGPRDAGEPGGGEPGGGELGGGELVGSHVAARLVRPANGHCRDGVVNARSSALAASAAASATATARRLARDRRPEFGGQSSGAQPLPTPLATSVQAGGGTWATVAMGDLSQPLNTFWQLLFRPDGSAAWSDRVEATAVATNGGLVLAGGGNALVVGVRPSTSCTFSPLISTTNAGRSWSNGLLGQGLAPHPAALANGPTAGRWPSWKAGRGTKVVRDTGNLLSWQPVTTARTLASAASATAL